MSKIAIVVEFVIKPGQRDAFLNIIRAHAKGTLAEEEGCLQFDVLIPKEGDNRVLLYEAYRDEAAFQEHGKSPRLARTRASYGEMIESRTINACTAD